MTHQTLLIVGAALAIMITASVFSRRTGVATPLLLVVLGIELEILQRRYLHAMRDALVTERTIGVYSSDTYRQVESLLDAIEQRLRIG